jgi:hypothetical protein
MDGMVGGTMTLLGLFLVTFGMTLARAGLRILPPKMRNEFNKAFTEAVKEAMK